MTNRRKVRRSTSWMRASGKHCVGLSVAMLLNVVLSALPVRGQATETVLYSFTGGTDGAYPDAGVIRDAKGDLYGTTTSGGLNQPACYLGCGVVYKIGTDGTETVLHAFAGYPTDGDRPFATVALDSAGNLYGTTSEGGPNAYGIVFKLDATGTETLLYSFAGQSPNGTDPSGGLILDTAGNIYGSTGAGGAFNYGTQHFFGSVPGSLKVGQQLVASIVGIAVTHSGNGYWMVGKDGGVFNYGDAPFLGSTYTALHPGQPLNAPIAGIQHLGSATG